MTRLSRARSRTLLGCALVVCAACSGRTFAVGAQGLPSRLVLLAKQAGNQRGWPALRRYAQSRIPREVRGWASFVLGYREYDAGEFAVAEKDLASAAVTRFALADLAEYYEASAAYENGQPARTVEVLRQFWREHPQSTVRDDAVELLAWAYLQSGAPAEAIRVLTAVPEVREKPKLALLLGRAYGEAGRPLDAALADQNVYYAYPATSQAKAASEALDELKPKLGANFPRVSDRIVTARVEKLSEAARYNEALKEYGELLKDRRESELAWQWNLGRARCLLELGKPDETIETLVAAVPVSPVADAERLEILVQAYLQKKDEESAAASLDQLQAHFSASRQYARALLAVANYFMREPDWDLAGVSYHTLASAFPATSEGRTATWRAAWVEYLQGKEGPARDDFLHLIKRYPSSARVAAAIYFLGRLAESAHHPAEARHYYELVRDHFLHEYYGVEAARRLRALGAPTARLRTAAGSAAKGQVLEIARLIPAPDPVPFNPCDGAAENGLLRPFFRLQVLGLDDLAREGARNLLARDHASTSLVLGVSRLEAETGRTDLAIFRVMKLTPDYGRYRFEELPAGIWALLYPRPYWSLVRERAAANGLDPYFVMGLIRQESGFNPQAASPSDARGLMQVLPETAFGSHAGAGVEKLYEPSLNVRLGCTYLRQLLKRYKGNVRAALAAYNAGPSRVDEWLAKYPSKTPEEFIETIPFPGTRTYVKAVFGDETIYRTLLAGSAKFKACRAPARARRKR